MGGGEDKVEETEYSKELAEIATKEWDKYQESYVPVENQFISRVDKMGKEQTYKDVAGDVSTSYKSSFSDAGKQQDKSLAAAGFDPSSGKSQTARSDMADTEAKTMADATSKAQNNVTQAYTGQLGNVVAMGKGQETQSIQGLQDLSMAATQKANSDAITEANETSIPAAVAGAGASYVANTPNALKSAFAPSDMGLIKAGPKDELSPIGGASSYGLGK